MPEYAYVAIGSNVDPERHLALAVSRFAEIGLLHAVSNVYRTRPVGGPPQPDYLNAAAKIETTMTPLQLRDGLRRIEAALGRVRTADAYAPRTIDLDVSLYGHEVIPALRIPDPDIETRAYLAVTLSEVDPVLRYPMTGESLEAIAARLRAGATLLPHRELSAVLRTYVSGA